MQTKLFVFANVLFIIPIKVLATSRAAGCDSRYKKIPYPKGVGLPLCVALLVVRCIFYSLKPAARIDGGVIFCRSVLAPLL